MGKRARDASRYKKTHAKQRWKWHKKKMRKRKRKKKYIKDRLK